MAVVRQLLKRFYAKPTAATEKALESLKPFVPEPGFDRLPNVRGINPKDLGLQQHPWQHRQPQTLMRAIDYESRLRHDPDERTELFAHEGRGRPGAIVLVKQYASRAAPKLNYFAGVLLSVTRKGVMSSIVLRTVIAGVSVEKRVPIYSPMVHSFTVLQPSPPALVRELQDRDEINFARKDPKKARVDFGAVELLLLKHRNQELRAK